MIEQAFILAAGFGTRLRPLTDICPKPLLPVANRPLLDLILDHLAGLGVRQIGLNLHHLAGQIEAHLSRRNDPFETMLYHEDEIKGTGGGLGQAGPEFGNGSLLVINGDVAFDFDLEPIVRQHQESGAAVSMVLHDRPGLNQVMVQGGRIIGFRNDRPGNLGGEPRRLAYTCVQVIEPVVFDFLPAKGKGDLIDAYRTMIRAGLTLRAHILPGGHFWTDIGHAEDYLDLHAEVLVKGRRIFNHRSGGPVIVGRDGRIDRGAVVRGFAAVGPGAVIEAGADIHESVILDGAWLGPRAVVSRSVIGPGVLFGGQAEGKLVVA